MGPDGIVVDTPSLDDPARLGKREEGVLIEAFIAQPSVEALDEGILDRLARCDVVPFDTGILGEIWVSGHRARRDAAPMLAPWPERPLPVSSAG